ncbi:hypothetical protein Tco_1175647, partial [Tanacetum coccineum]
MARNKQIEPEFYQAMLLKLKARGVIKWSVGSKQCLKLVKSPFWVSRAFRLGYNSHQRRIEKEKSWTLQYILEDAAMLSLLFTLMEAILCLLERKKESLFFIVVHFISGSMNVIQRPCKMRTASFIDHPQSVTMFVDVAFDKRGDIRMMRFILLHAFALLDEILGIRSLHEKPYIGVVDVDANFTGIIPISVSTFVTRPLWEFKMERIFSPFGVNGCSLNEQNSNALFHLFHLSVQHAVKTGVQVNIFRFKRLSSFALNQ